jgi:hypothetical protein
VVYKVGDKVMWKYNNTPEGFYEGKEKFIWDGSCSVITKVINPGKWNLSYELKLIATSNYPDIEFKRGYKDKETGKWVIVGGTHALGEITIAPYGLIRFCDPTPFK